MKHFYTQSPEEMIRYVKKHADKYISFYDARLSDKRMANIQGSFEFRSSSTLRRTIYSMFKGGKEQREHKAVTRLVNQIKDISQVEKIEKEFYLNDKCRVDIKVTLTSGRILLLEVKHDKSQWTEKSTSSQVIRYSKVASRLFGRLFHKTLLCSPEGTYGHSFLEVNSYINAL